MTPDPLEPLPEDWQRALCVVAHPDDLEFGAAAAIARWTGQGKEIVYAMVTSGEAGIDCLHPDECQVVREAEQIESARIVGVDTVEFLGQPDGVLEYGVPLRAVIAHAVRRHRPEVVITGNFHPTWGGENLNQADHIAVGKAVLDAVRDAGNRWVFHDQLVDGLEPWGDVGAVWVSGSPRRPARRRHDRHVRRGGRLPRGAPGLHRRPRLGRLRRPRVPRGDGPAHRTAPRHHDGGGVRGLPPGLGQLSMAEPHTDDHCEVWRRATWTRPGSRRRLSA